MYTCTFCVAAKAGTSAALTFPSDTTWLEHLISPEHGDVQRTQGAKKSMAQWDDNRTVVATGTLGLKARSLINYFIGFGDLQNFYYVHKEDGKSQYCKVLMVEEKSAKIIHKAGNHTIGNITFQTRIQNKPAAKAPPLPPPPPQSKLDMHPFLSATEIASTSTTSDSVPTSIASTISSSKSTRVSARFRKLYATSEGGFFKEAGYRCQICELDVGRGEEQWVQHLISEKHQDVHRQNQHLRKVLWDLDKKLMITQTKGLKSVHILRYVTAHGGPVIDFSYLAKSKNDGDINVCYTLFATKAAAEKLVMPAGTHCIGPQRKNVLMSLIDDKTKLKWRKWKDKLLNSTEECDLNTEDDDGDNSEEIIAESENKANDNGETETFPKEEEEMNIQIVSVTTLVPIKITEEKSSIASSGENHFSSFKGLSLEAQLEQCRTTFGWSPTFSNEAIQFVNQTVGKLNLKQKKIPFGDLTTGLGLQKLSALQLLVDVQELLESNPNSADSMISSIIKSSTQALSSLKEKHTTEHPILKVSTADSTEICINSVIAGKATNLKLRFSNSLPSHECNLFKLYCNLDPRILPMSFVIALWATSNNFLQDFKQSYPNQVIILLIMGFLQKKKVLPTVQKLQEIVSDSESQKFVNGNNVTFCTDVDTIKKLHPNPLEDILKDDTIRAMSVIGLVKDWFQLFANADLKENTICTRFGYLIPKKDFQPHSVGNLPGDLCRVYRFGMSNDRSSNMASAIESVSTKKFICSQTPLCIQHPFDLTLNCSRGVTPGEVTKFQNGCKEAVTILSNLLTSDQPDLTEFLIKTIPLNGPTTSVIPGEVCIDSPTFKIPKKSNAVVPSAISNVTGNNQSSARNCDVVVTASSSKTSPAQLKSRPGASDFFDDVGNNEDQSNDADMISEDDESNDSIFIKDCTVFLNSPLFNYWARTFSGTRDMQYQKLQLLILQHLLEFNQKFWTNCLGLVNMPKIGQKFWAEEYSKVIHDGKIRSNQTVLQKVMAISDSEKEIDLSFRVKSDGRTIHKLFLDEYSQSLRPKIWASGKSLTDFSLLLYEEVPEARLQEIKTTSFIACNKLQPEICYDCRLLGEISKSFSKTTPLATLTMTSVSPGINVERVDVIKSVYRKLAMSYINKMVKRWLYESKDFDQQKADNFIKSRNEKWNQKANKKRKREAKLQANKKEDRSVAPKNPSQIPIHNPRANSNNSKNHNNTDRIATAQGQSFHPRLVRTPTSNNVRSGLPPHLMSLTVRPTTNMAKPQQSYHQQGQTTWASGGGSGVGNHPQFSQQHPSSYARQPNISYGSPATALGPTFNYEPPYQERIVRNPEPQGMRTFNPPSVAHHHYNEQPNHPRIATHLLPNPQFSSFNQISIGGNTQSIPLQNTESLLPHGINATRIGIDPRNQQVNDSYHQQIDSSNRNRVYQNIAQNIQYTYRQQQLHQGYPNDDPYNDQQDKYNPTHLRQNQRQIYDQQPLPPLINDNPRFDAFNNQDHDLSRFPNPTFDYKASNNSLNPNNRFFSSDSRSYDQEEPRHQSNLAPRSSALFESSYSRPNQFNKNNGSHNVRQVTLSPRRIDNQRSMRVDEDNSPAFTTTNGGAPRNTRYFNCNSNDNSNLSSFEFPSCGNAASTTSSLRRHGSSSNAQQISYGSRPSQPMKRGFISGGYLSTQSNEMDNTDDDDLQIIYDLNPKGNSSPPPPPPPLKKYKIGPAFPVPSRPDIDGRERSTSPMSSMHRKSSVNSPRNERRGGQVQESFSSRVQRNQREISPIESVFVTPNSFQGFGINPCAGDSAHFYGGRRF